MPTFRSLFASDWDVGGRHAMSAKPLLPQGFTLRQFVARYAKKFCANKEKMMVKLWAYNFNPATKKWSTKNADVDGKPLERAFNMFVLGSIFATVINGKKTSSP